MWKSPLKAGCIVTCTDGLVVKILQDPVWKPDQKRYSVRVDVLVGSGKGEDEFYHLSPNSFKVRTFKTIEPPGKTLEEEFFERKGKQWASSI